MRLKKGLGNSKSFLHQNAIFSGRAVIFTTPASNGVWQFRTWISGEKRYVRESLRTRDKSEAIAVAEQKFLQITSDIAAGRKIFSITVGELVQQFLADQAERVTTKKITKGRLGTIKTQLTRHFTDFCGGPNALVSNLNPETFRRYAQYRRLKTRDVKEVTIRNEQTTLAAIMRFAFRKGYTGFEHVYFEEIKIREYEKRDTFTLEEYERLYRFMRTWSAQALSEKEKANRQFIRDFILIAANTFARFGELRNLKWRNISIKKISDKNLNLVDDKRTLVQIDLEAAITKNRKSRTLLARGGSYVQRIKSYSKFTNPDDFIFVDNRTGKQLDKKVYYNCWAELMEGSGIETERRNLTYYSLRHFGITQRLIAGVPIYDVAKIAGTSVSFIENFYEHMDMSKMIESATKDVRRDQYGMIYRD
jgi:integrase